MIHRNEHGDCVIREYDFERLNYHYGQMMVERDFRDQQRYYNEKRWMINRFGIGWGVVHGLKVRIVSEKADTGKCSEMTPPDVEIEPGFALDQYGNEILVTATHKICTSACIDRKDGSSGEEKQGSAHHVYIGVRYRECGTEPFRIPDAHCCDVDNDCRYSRTREGQEFVFSRKLWNHDCNHDQNVQRDDNGCIIDCFRNLRDPVTKLIGDHPDRNHYKVVPLAVLSFKKGRWLVDNTGVREVAYSNYRLGELVGCLTGELKRTYAAGYDRRSFVPLLAQTIPGLNWRSGRTKLYENIGEVPLRITTDGKCVWCTDAQEDVVHRIPIEKSMNNPFPLRISLSSKSAGWGIAFTGDAMWVTIPGKNAVEKINVCTMESKIISLGEQSCNPREIVYDGNYLWISQGPVSGNIDEQDGNDEHQTEGKENNHDDEHNDNVAARHHHHHDMNREKISNIRLLRLDPFDGEVEFVEIPLHSKARVSPVAGMAFDGYALWITYNDHEHRALVRRVNIYQIGFTDHHHPDKGIADEPIHLRGNGVHDIAFDGNAIWVTHDEGASKIDIMEYAEIGVSNGRGRLSSMVFDGQGMWTIQNRENESELKKCNLHSLQFEGGYELRKGKSGFHIGRMCFDGAYLWLTGYKTDEKTGKGIIYRIIP